LLRGGAVAGQWPAFIDLPVAQFKVIDDRLGHAVLLLVGA
jgi:hypothetical protein